MTKFLILYNSSETSSQTMSDATPEQMKASMDEWIDWRDEASKTAKVEFGLPVQAVASLSQGGESDSSNQASGYSIIEADSKDAVSSLLSSHPHLKRPGASIDVMEMLAMPGIEG